MLQAILFQGSRYLFNTDNTEMNLAKMFGFIKQENGVVAIANRIFEVRLYNYFLSKEELLIIPAQSYLSGI